MDKEIAEYNKDYNKLLASEIIIHNAGVNESDFKTYKAYLKVCALVSALVEVAAKPESINQK